MSKTILVAGKRRKRVQHDEADRLSEVCQNTVCHDAAYHSKDWIGADEEGVMGYITCELHGVLLGIEHGGGRGGEWSCVFCECCRGTCADHLYGQSCSTCGKEKKR